MGKETGGETEKKIYTRNVVGVAKSSSSLLFSLEKSALSSKLFKASIYWVEFLCYGLAYFHGLEREMRHSPAQESHQLHSYYRS